MLQDRGLTEKVLALLQKDKATVSAVPYVTFARTNPSLHKAFPHSSCSRSTSLVVGITWRGTRCLSHSHVNPVDNLSGTM
jgi:hypothetical protein